MSRRRKKIMDWQSTFRVAIRLVFLFAFIAFLSASISHVATFFHNFEQDKTNWISPYMLAVSIDLTALVLTIGVMFFRKDMPWYAVVITWIFIFALTTFSWIVNWEYARTYQGADLKAGPLLALINPVLASAFAFLNLAYSFVSEFFNTKVKTADELQKELDRLEALEKVQARLNDYHSRNKKKGIIQRAKDTVIEAKQAVKEVINNEVEPATNAAESASQADGEHTASSTLAEATNGSVVPSLGSIEVEPSEEIDGNNFEISGGTDEQTNVEAFDEQDGSDDGTDSEVDTDPEVEVVNVTQFHRHGTLLPSSASSKLNVTRRKPFSIAEAAEFLECSERYVRELRKSGTLVADQNGMVTAASVKAYRKKRDTKVG
jgi:hypothetical protein